MTDGRDRLALFEETLDELDSLRLHAQLVGIHHAARKQQSVVTAGVGGLERHVHWHFLAPLFVVPASNFAFLGRNYFRRSAGLFERFLRFQKLSLFESAGCEDRYFLAL